MKTILVALTLIIGSSVLASDWGSWNATIYNIIASDQKVSFRIEGDAAKTIINVIKDQKETRKWQDTSVKDMHFDFFENSKLRCNVHTLTGSSEAIMLITHGTNTFYSCQLLD